MASEKERMEEEEEEEVLLMSDVSDLLEPCSAVFAHVEAAVDFGVRAGMLVELPFNEDEKSAKMNDDDDSNKVFWLAKVIEVFGSLVKLSFVGDDNYHNVMWHDLGKTRLYPLGWSQHHKHHLRPPSHIASKLDTWKQMALDYLEDSSIGTVGMHHAACVPATPAARIQVGQVAELRDERQGHFYLVQVAENHNGLLALKPMLKKKKTENQSNMVFNVDSDECVEHIFFTSDRLFPVGHANAHRKKYGLPSRLNSSSELLCSNFEEVEYFMEKLKLKPIPSDLIKSNLTAHKVKLDTKVEVVTMLDGVRRGRVARLLDDAHFIVEMGNDVSNRSLKKESILCHRQSPRLMEDEWALKSGFLVGQKPLCKSKDTLSEDNNELEMQTRHKATRRGSLIPNFIKDKMETSEDLGFEVGQVLEVFEKGRCRLHRIVRAVDNVLCLQALCSQRSISSSSSNQDPHNSQYVLLPAQSWRLFPPGWSHSNGVPLYGPKSLVQKTKFEGWNAPSVDEGTRKQEVLKKDDRDEESSWCPAVYFNYQCYSSSFISKARLSGLPRQVGPGSVRLVMTEVLSHLLRTSFKSGNILKRLEKFSCFQNDHDSYVYATLKAKSRVLNLQAEVAVPTRRVQVEHYCRSLCQMLAACPNLVSLTRVQDGQTCPADCRNGRFLIRGMKRKIEDSKENSEEENTKDNGNDADEEDVSSSRCESPVVDESKAHGDEDEDQTTRTMTTAAKKTIIAKEANHRMTTRGARLPDYGSVFKVYKTTKKDLERVLEDTRPKSPPPKPPPPIIDIVLASNPEHWTCVDVAAFLAQTGDCGHLATFMIDDDIDGISFMLLTFQTIIQHWRLTLTSTVALCRHVESVKWAHFRQFYQKKEEDDLKFPNLKTSA